MLTEQQKEQAEQEAKSTPAPRENNAAVRRTQTLSGSPKKSFFTTTAENSDIIAGGAEKFLWTLAGGFLTSSFTVDGWIRYILIAASIMAGILACIVGFIKNLLPQSPTIKKIKQARKDA